MGQSLTVLLRRVLEAEPDRGDAVVSSACLPVSVPMSGLRVASRPVALQSPTPTAGNLVLA